ncbi:unannotated protein [freshwater metagenome]|uniref:Unannotated protein n=1 Tax=freshwater metagenome TaxID=449393 RepID=A0A6J6M1T6_9ZZZZ
MLRSLVSPTNVVKDLQLLLTSVFTKAANWSPVAGVGAEPAQLTVTISITRSSTARAGVKPRPTKQKLSATNIDVRFTCNVFLAARLSVTGDTL